MDNPQHYQPLSHALHTHQPYPFFQKQPQPQQQQQQQLHPPLTPTTHTNDVDDHDDDDDDDNDQPKSKSGGPTSPRLPPVSDNTNGPDQPDGEAPTKRRPGRPRGSKNKKPRAPPGTSAKYLQQHQQGQTHPDTTMIQHTQHQQQQQQLSQQQQHHHSQQHPHHPHQQQQTQQQQQQQQQQHQPQQAPEVNAQNHQYYEFQWRMLTLCAEFYGAAEELLKGTPPLVLAQCYQMGPTAKVDPLNLLSEAKRMCDELLQNPQRLINQPPPPIIPVIPNYYPHPYTKSILASPPPAINSPPSSGIITNPGTFVVPLHASPSSTTQSIPPATVPAPQAPPHPQPPPHPTPAPPNATYAPYTYTTTPTSGSASGYYQYTYPQTSAAAAPTAGGSSGATTSAIVPTLLNASAPVPSVPTNSWSDEESEKLRKLAEASRNSSGDIDWDAVVAQWGGGRTRHQILIKATAMGLRDSSGGVSVGNVNVGSLVGGPSRGTKRRHGGDEVQPSPSSPSLSKQAQPPPPTPLTSATTPTTAGTSGVTTKVLIPHSGQSTQTQNTPQPQRMNLTPHTSPALHHPQPPVQSAQQNQSKMTWAMPTVAVNAPSPIMEERGLGGAGAYGSYNHRGGTMGVHHPSQAQRGHSAFLNAERR